MFASSKMAGVHRIDNRRNDKGNQGLGMSRHRTWGQRRLAEPTAGALDWSPDSSVAHILHSKATGIFLKHASDLITILFSILQGLSIPP